MKAPRPTDIIGTIEYLILQLDKVHLIRWSDFTDADATPSVSGGRYFKTANTGATTITDFNDPPETGHKITILFTDTNTTIQHGANIVLQSGSNFTGAVDDVKVFLYDDNNWVEQAVDESGTGVFREVATNNIFGPNAGGSFTQGAQNFGVGSGALDKLNGSSFDAFGNTGIGLNAGNDITTAEGCTLIGPNAGANVTVGDDNNFIGEQCGVVETTGQANNAMGDSAMASTSDADWCCAFGQSALTSGAPNLSGLGNNAFGAWAGENLEGDSNRNLYLGYFAGPPTDTVEDDMLYVDSHATTTPLIEGDFAGHTIDINGTLSKTAGSFKIDHPLNNKRILWHGFIEGPEYGLRYRGSVKLQDGKAFVNIDKACNMTPGTFSVLAADCNVWVQNSTDFDRVKPSKIIGADFSIQCENLSSGAEVIWRVEARRKDAFIMQSEATDEMGRLILEKEKSIDRRNEDAEHERNGTHRFSRHIITDKKAHKAAERIRCAALKRDQDSKLYLDSHILDSRHIRRAGMPD